MTEELAKLGMARAPIVPRAGRYLGFAAALTACLSLWGTTTAAAEDVVTISTPLETIDSFVPMIGKEIGAFSKQGLDIQFVKGIGGPTMVSAVVGGSADVTTAASSVIFSAIQKGADLTVLTGNTDIDYTLVAQKNSGFDLSKGYPDILFALKGKTIGVAVRGGATEAYVRKILADAKLDPDKDVTMIAVGGVASAVPSFTNHQIDVLASISPTNVLLDKNNYDVIVDIPTTHTKVYNEKFLFTVLTANASFVKTRPKVAEEFCRGVVETDKFINDPKNEDAVKAFVARTVHLTPSQADEFIKEYRSLINTRLSLERWQSVQEFGYQVPDWSSHVYEPCAKISQERS